MIPLTLARDESAARMWRSINSLWSVLVSRPPVLFHFLAQSSYIVASFWLFGAQRDWRQWAALQLFSFVLVAILDKSRSGPRSHPLLVAAIANSVFLNLDSTFLRAILPAAFVAFLLRRFFRIAGRPVFNSSAIGAFTLAILAPAYASSATLNWQDSWAFDACIFVIGSFVAWRASRYWVATGYQGGMVAVGVILHRLPLGSYQPFPSAWLIPSVLLGAGPLIFTYHVITDPQTSPSSCARQLAFGGAIGAFQALLMTAKVLPPDLLSYLVVLSGMAFFRLRAEPSSRRLTARNPIH